jgi:hypothetical protein
MSFASITQRFVVWFLLVSLLPILLLSYSLLHTFEKELQHTVFQQISAIADKKADQIDSYLAERVHHAMVLQQGSGASLPLWSPGTGWSPQPIAAWMPATATTSSASSAVPGFTICS